MSETIVQIQNILENSDLVWQLTYVPESKTYVIIAVQKAE